MTDLLDIPLADLDANRALEASVIRAISLSAGDSWMAAYEKLRDGAERAHENGQRTLPGALTASFLDADAVGEILTLLARRDAVVDRAASPAGRKMLDSSSVESSFGFRSRRAPTGGVAPARPLAAPGRVTAEQAGRLITDPAERERRNIIARRLGYGDGFDELDKTYLRGGHDVLTTAQTQEADRAAQVRAQQLAHQLDASLNEMGRERARLRATEAQASAIEDRGARDAALSELRTQMTATTATTVRLLDSAEAEADHPVMLDASQADPDGNANVASDQERLGQLRNTQTPSAFLKTLESYVATGALPDTNHAAPATPPGVHPGSHELHKRVRARMRELDAAERDYPTVLLDVMAEDG
jgi:hypothetical protein